MLYQKDLLIPDQGNLETPENCFVGQIDLKKHLSPHSLT